MKNYDRRLENAALGRRPKAAFSSPRSHACLHGGRVPMLTGVPGQRG